MESESFATDLADARPHLVAPSGRMALLPVPTIERSGGAARWRYDIDGEWRNGHIVMRRDGRETRWRIPDAGPVWSDAPFHVRYEHAPAVRQPIDPAAAAMLALAAVLPIQTPRPAPSMGLARPSPASRPRPRHRPEWFPVRASSFELRAYRGLQLLLPDPITRRLRNAYARAFKRSSAETR